jgi:hypothetical protein
MFVHVFFINKHPRETLLIIYSCAVQWSELHYRCWSSLLQHTWQPGPTQVRRNQCCGSILIESGSGFRLFCESGFRYNFLHFYSWIFLNFVEEILWSSPPKKTSSTFKNKILYFLLFIVVHLILLDPNPGSETLAEANQICLVMLCLICAYNRQGKYFDIWWKSHYFIYASHRHLGAV